ncbi:unnamed protein product, partial [Rhizoctonia solani]
MLPGSKVPKPKPRTKPTVSIRWHLEIRPSESVVCGVASGLGKPVGTAILILTVDSGIEYVRSPSGTPPPPMGPDIGATLSAL